MNERPIRTREEDVLIQNYLDKVHRRLDQVEPLPKNLLLLLIAFPVIGVTFAMAVPPEYHEQIKATFMAAEGLVVGASIIAWMGPIADLCEMYGEYKEELRRIRDTHS